MGLDITAYSRIEKVEEKDYDEYNVEVDSEGYLDDYDYNRCTSLHVNPDFPGRADDIEDRAIYTFEDEYDFRAGSYSGYGAWRRELALLTKYATPQTIWDGIDDGTISEQEDFLELICFSDCEGTIGSEVSARLFDAFKRHESRILEVLGPSEYDWFVQRYNDWMNAFELASDNGAVQFH